jgi:hypothetical protein
MGEREAQQCLPALQVEFARDMGAVILNSPNTQAKLASDVARVHACRNELEYAPLGRSELFQARPLLPDGLKAIPPVQKKSG